MCCAAPTRGSRLVPARTHMNIPGPPHSACPQTSRLRMPHRMPHRMPRPRPPYIPPGPGSTARWRVGATGTLGSRTCACRTPLRFTLGPPFPPPCAPRLHPAIPSCTFCAYLTDAPRLTLASCMAAATRSRRCVLARLHRGVEGCGAGRAGPRRHARRAGCVGRGQPAGQRGRPGLGRAGRH